MNTGDNNTGEIYVNHMLTTQTSICPLVCIKATVLAHLDGNGDITLGE